MFRGLWFATAVSLFAIHAQARVLNPEELRSLRKTISFESMRDMIQTIQESSDVDTQALAAEVLRDALQGFNTNAPVERGYNSDGPWSTQAIIPLEIFTDAAELRTHSNPQVVARVRDWIGSVGALKALIRSVGPDRVNTEAVHRLVVSLRDFNPAFLESLQQILQARDHVGEGDWNTARALAAIAGLNQHLDELARGVTRYFNTRGYLAILERVGHISPIYIGELLESSYRYELGFSTHSPTPGAYEALLRIQNELGIERFDEVVESLAMAARTDSWKLSQLVGAIDFWRRQGRWTLARLHLLARIPHDWFRHFVTTDSNHYLRQAAWRRVDGGLAALFEDALKDLSPEQRTRSFVLAAGSIERVRDWARIARVEYEEADSAARSPTVRVQFFWESAFERLGQGVSNIRSRWNQWIDACQNRLK